MRHRNPESPNAWGIQEIYFSGECRENQLYLNKPAVRCPIGQWVDDVAVFSGAHTWLKAYIDWTSAPRSACAPPLVHGGAYSGAQVSWGLGFAMKS